MPKADISGHARDDTLDTDAAGASSYDACEDRYNTPAPPDGGWGWVVMCSAFFMLLLVDGIIYSFGIFYLEFLEHYQENKGKTSLPGAVLIGTYNCAGLIASGIVSRYGARPVAVGGSILAAVGLILSTFSPNIDILIVTYGLVAGLGLGSMYLPAIIIVGLYFEKRRAFATGLATCGSAVGGFIYPPLSEKLIEVFGWKGAMLIMAGITLNGMICGALFRPLNSQVERRKYVMERDIPIDAAAEDEDKGLKTPFSATCTRTIVDTCSATRKLFDLALLTDPVFLIYGLSCFLCVSNILVPSMYVPDYAVGLGMSRDKAAFLLVPGGISNTVSRIVFGLITDQPWADCLLINNLSLVIGGIMIICCPLSTNYGLLCTYITVVGVTIGTYTLLRSIILIEFLGKERFAKSFGLLSVCQGTGGLVGIQMAGSIYDLTGSYHVTFYIAGSIIVTSGIICFPLRRLAAWQKKKKTRKNRTQSERSHEENTLVVQPLSEN